MICTFLLVFVVALFTCLVPEPASLVSPSVPALGQVAGRFLYRFPQIYSGRPVRKGSRGLLHRPMEFAMENLYLDS